LVIVGTDNTGLLHIRIFDASGALATDWVEKNVPPTHAEAISNLKKQLKGLEPTRVRTPYETGAIIKDATKIVGRRDLAGDLVDNPDRGKKQVNIGEVPHESPFQSKEEYSKVAFYWDKKWDQVRKWVNYQHQLPQLDDIIDWDYVD
jgi:hypothetical protein